MNIGAPRRPSPEPRVGITPEIAERYLEDGHPVQVEHGAGEAAGLPDEAFREAGCEMVGSAWEADVVVTVGTPGDAELSRMAPGAWLLGLLRPLDDPHAMRVLAEADVTAIAFETLPRTTRAQSMDALSSQATLAGYEMVLEAASRLPRIFPMMVTAAGTIRPATVLVLGCGVAGLQAIATARRLGAVVRGYDVRASAAEQVRSLGASFIDLDVTPQDSSASGGYARPLSGGDGSRRTTGTTTWHSGRVMGVSGHAVGGVLRGGAHGELVHIRFPEYDPSGPAETGHGGGLERRDVPFENPRCARRGLPQGAEIVLDRNRDPCERPLRGHGLPWVQGQERIEVRLFRGPAESRAEEVVGGHHPGTHSPGDLEGRFTTHHPVSRAGERVTSSAGSRGTT